MAAVFDCPTRLLKIRIGGIDIAKSDEWCGITITRMTQGQYQIEGYGKVQKVGSGRLTQERARAMVIQAVLALYETRRAYQLPLPGFGYEVAA